MNFNKTRLNCVDIRLGNGYHSHVGEEVLNGVLAGNRYLVPRGGDNSSLELDQNWEFIGPHLQIVEYPLASLLR